MLEMFDNLFYSFGLELFSINRKIVELQIFFDKYFFWK